MDKVNKTRTIQKFKTPFVCAFVLVMIAITSCKKNNNGTSTITTQEKKWMVSTVAGDLIPNYRDGSVSVQNSNIRWM